MSEFMDIKTFKRNVDNLLNTANRHMLKEFYLGKKFSNKNDVRLELSEYFLKESVRLENLFKKK